MNPKVYALKEFNKTLNTVFSAVKHIIKKYAPDDYDEDNIENILKTAMDKDSILVIEELKEPYFKFKKKVDMKEFISDLEAINDKENFENNIDTYKKLIVSLIIGDSKIDLGEGINGDVIKICRFNKKNIVHMIKCMDIYFRL